MIGVLSDTHGLLRPEAVNVLTGVEIIIHAGDVGDPQILERLREIAPVFAVRGNVDKGAWAERLPETEVVEIGEVMLYVLHDLNALDLDPAAAGFGAVISGHTHETKIEWRKGILYLNPGSVGPRRFKLPIAMALVEVEGKMLRARIVEL